MKKIISIFTIVIFTTLLIFSSNSYADTLDNINVNVNKTLVRPSEDVKLTVNFGQELGAYTFNIAYDSNIFEYIGVEGGTANDTQDKVIVTYYDQTGGTNPRTNMTITFKAKENITTSNPTEFLVTADGLSNADASITYDDITVPIVKNITVEPEYIDYDFKIEYTGDIIKEKEKEMKLSYFSPMGRYYEHARLIAKVTKPENTNVKLLAIDSNDLEQDIIQSGFGDAQGYSIGGKDVLQTLQTRAIFSDIGNYTITLQLIDRETQDQVIQEKSFNFTVGETVSEVTIPSEDNSNKTTKNDEEISNIEEKMPVKLPKTGQNIYLIITLVLLLLVSSYVYFNRKK